MLHIATVHWLDDRWVDIQLKYLNHCISIPFKVYAFTSGLSENHRSKYFYSSSEMIVLHPVKLNILADLVMMNSNDPNDLLMFIDGDAFPIGDIITYANDKLKNYPLIAIQRKENVGDIQPHPSFCLTTVQLWKSIRGDWKKGHRWINAKGKSVTDVGGNLLRALEENQIKWYPMLRSNRRNLHPLWFGVYDDIVYHHGAGFRLPVSRFDISKFSKMRRFYQKIYKKLPAPVQNAVPPDWRPLAKAGRINEVLCRQVFDMIRSDFHFHRYFTQEVSPAEDAST